MAPVCTTAWIGSSGDATCLHPPARHARGDARDQPPAVSKHLRVLRKAGSVDAQVDAQRRLYHVRPEPLRELDEWLAPYREMWATSLDALAQHLDEMDQPNAAPARGRPESDARRKTR